ncbi:MAG: vanadium-dependent haloperoxidase [Bacteroidia bacterium]|nr:vanadium-dependent haloperoxidase [Bacteroidia bacterium]
MRYGILLLLTGLLLAVLTACNTPGGQQAAAQADYTRAGDDPEIHRQLVFGLTEVIIYDIFSPPVASRIYAYTSVAAYEALVPGYPEYRSLAGQLREFAAPPAPPAQASICYPLASAEAYLTVSKALTFSADKTQELQDSIHARFRRAGIPDAVFAASAAYGKAVGDHVIAWAGKDNYKETRTFPKFDVKNEPGRWVPTPPMYTDAMEPHWNKIRPLTLDSAAQFKPARPYPYDLGKRSPFYKDLMEVYQIGAKPDSGQQSIAYFWDDNAFVSNVTGHMTFASKKMTPGGHWMAIATVATRQAKTGLPGTVEAHTRTAIALFDGFISCWDEKYRSNVVRPETVINQHLDEDWAPFLQTPPFPEYTSGHSVISASAATVLTELFGDSFAFTDTTENLYGRTERRFASFYQASDEASISRLYGGIHYRAGLENGALQGRNVGRHVTARLETRRRAQAAAQP